MLGKKPSVLLVTPSEEILRWKFQNDGDLFMDSNQKWTNLYNNEMATDDEHRDLKRGGQRSEKQINKMRL